MISAVERFWFVDVVWPEVDSILFIGLFEYLRCYEMWTSFGLRTTESLPIQITSVQIREFIWVTDNKVSKIYIELSVKQKPITISQ